MNKINANQPIPKGNFGHDLSNSISNKEKNYSNTKNSKSILNKAESYYNPYAIDASSTPQKILLTRNNAPNSLFISKNAIEHASSLLNQESNFDNSKPLSVSCKNDTSNDEDDEKNTESNVISSSVYSSSVADDSIESKDINSNDDSPKFYALQEEFQSITKSLFNQVTAFKDDAHASQILSQSLTRSLSFAKEERLAERNEIQANFNIMIENLKDFYETKFKEFEKQSEDNCSQIRAFEDLFHKIQRYQADVYQDELRNLKDQLQKTKDELSLFRGNYQLLEQWVLTMFKVIGERAKTWNNQDFILTTKEISKAIKPPSKKSELHSMYRYLMEYLYLEELQEKESSELKEAGK